MNIARILILALAGFAAIGAAIFVRGAMQAPSAPPQASIAEERAPAPSVRVLAARNDFAAGQRIQPADLYWQAWPEEALSPAYITEGAQPDAMTRFSGAIARASMAQGEPVSERKLVQPGDAGFMAAVIAPGMRAVAVPTSAETGAGGFIMPNDRVDVIATANTSDRRMVSRTVVENVRVLAIDQTYSEEGDGAVVGSTATLELAPRHAEAVALAVAEGDISLALRSVSDGEGGPVSGEAEPVQTETGEARVVRVFRYGQEQRVALGGGQ